MYSRYLTCLLNNDDAAHAGQTAEKPGTAAPSFESIISLISNP